MVGGGDPPVPCSTSDFLQLRQRWRAQDCRRRSLTCTDGTRGFCPTDLRGVRNAMSKPKDQRQAFLTHLRWNFHNPPLSPRDYVAIEHQVSQCKALLTKDTEDGPYVGNALRAIGQAYWTRPRPTGLVVKRDTASTCSCSKGGSSKISSSTSSILSSSLFDHSMSMPSPSSSISS